MDGLTYLDHHTREGSAAVGEGTKEAQKVDGCGEMPPGTEPRAGSPKCASRFLVCARWLLQSLASREQAVRIVIG